MAILQVYHKPPNTFVENAVPLKKTLPPRAERGDADLISPGAGGAQAGQSGAQPGQSVIIPTQDSLIGDLLSLDMNPQPSGMQQPAPSYGAGGLDDLLGVLFMKLTVFFSFIDLLRLRH